MDNNTKVAFPSIFDTAVEADKEFDNMFGGEEDCDLMDAVCGFKEDGSVLPDDAELHQTDDDATPKDLADELGEDHDTKNAPKCDESDADVLNKKEGNNISCPKAGVEDSVAGDATKKIDPEDIEGEADKATAKFDEAYNALMREAAEDCGEEVPAAEETPAVETPDVTEGSEDVATGDDDVDDLVSDLDGDDEDIEGEEESGTVDNSDEAGDPPDEENPENVKEDAAALPADPDEEDLISKVEDETPESEPSSEELEKELNTDTDEDLIDIVSGSTE